MKELKNLNKYVGRYVKLQYWGEHIAKVTGFTDDEKALILEGPLIQTVFSTENNSMKSMKAICTVRTTWFLIHVEDLDEITEEEYKTELLKMTEQLDIADDETK